MRGHALVAAGDGPLMVNSQKVRRCEASDGAGIPGTNARGRLIQWAWCSSRVGTRSASVGGVARPSSTYLPRQPAESVLYQVVRDHVETFLGEAARQRTGHGLPAFVEREFRDYLRCGWLAGGFARFRCEGCGLDQLVRRAFEFDVLACPRCGGRLRLLALVEQAAVIERILRHLDLPTAVPQARPARAPPLAGAALATQAADPSAAELNGDLDC